MTGPWAWWSLQQTAQEEPEEPPQPTGWRKPLGWIPFRWMRRESFYRDLFINLLATGLVVVIGYVYAVGAGYVTSPSGAETLRGIWSVIWFIGNGIVIMGTVFWAFFFHHKEGDSRRKRIVRRVIWIVVMVFILLAQFQAFTGALNDSWVWPFNTPSWHVKMANEPD